MTAPHGRGEARSTVAAVGRRVRLQTASIALAAIITYLSDTYGQDHNRLMPTNPRERARCLEWCFFVISELDATSLYVMRRHGDLRHIYGEARSASEAAAAYFQQQMRAVERALDASRHYILGDRFTAADILLSTCITWAVRYGVAVSGTVTAYNARATARPAYAKMISQQGIDQAA